MIKFKNQKAYEAYKFIVDTCDSNNRCAFCPFFNGEAGCLLYRGLIPATWPHAELECDTCPAKNSCDEVTDFIDAEMWKKVAEENIVQTNNLKDEINALRKWLAEKARYIAKLENQIANAKEALKND